MIKRQGQNRNNEIGVEYNERINNGSVDYFTDLGYSQENISIDKSRLATEENGAGKRKDNIPILIQHSFIITD